MSSRLSFAQILQKKKSTDDFKGARNATGKVKNPQSQFNSPQCSALMPSLIELMNEYLQYPDEPEQTYILSFSDFDQGFDSVGSSQDFESGVNPLDSWIMTQSKFNNPKQKHQKIPNELLKYSRNKPNDRNNIMQNRQIKPSKQNKNTNLGNADNVFKFATKTPKQRSMESSSNDFNMNDSYKYGPTSPSAYRKPVNNKTMIVDTKIIQSQAYHHVSPSQVKKDAIPKMERSEKVQRKQSDKSNYSEAQEKEPIKKPPRYQQNYQDTDRKQQPKPPIQQIEPPQQKLLISKKNSQKSNVQQNPQQRKPVLKITKKQSQQEELLLAGIDQSPQNVMPALSDQQRRIEDAKKQITQYLTIKEKQSPSLTKIIESKCSPKQPIFSKQGIKVAEVTQTRAIEQSKMNSSKLVNYSFANNQGLQPNPGPIQSFAQQTKQQLKQIQQQNRNQENQRMLSCIEYTQSQADHYEELDEQSNAIQYRRNIEASQSIPQKRVQQINEPCTLQKYLPARQILIHPNQSFDQQTQNIQNVNVVPLSSNVIPVKIQCEKGSKLESFAKLCHQPSQQYSEMMQKVQVQPSIVNEQEPSSNFDQKQKDDESLNVMNSDHPRFRQLSEGQLFKSQQIPDRETRPVYHDVSSIDIYISESSNQSPQNQKNIQMVIPQDKNESKQIKIPKLNLKISDISSVSNQSHLESHPSPIKASTLKQSPIEFHSDNKNDSHAESQQPLSSHDSMNIQAHTNGYGFIYAMRVNSRNSSFTSNYNKSVSQSQNQSYCSSNFNKSNHSSLIIKEDAIKAEESFGFAGEEINMNKNKNNNRKYMESEPFARDQAIKSFCKDSINDCQSPVRNDKAELVAEIQKINEAPQPQELVQQSVAVEQVNVQAENQESRHHDGEQSMAIERVLVQVSKIESPQPSDNNVKSQSFEQESLIYKLNEQNLVCSDQNKVDVLENPVVDKINSFQVERSVLNNQQSESKVNSGESQAQNITVGGEKILQETVSTTVAANNQGQVKNQIQSTNQINVLEELKIQKRQSEPIPKQQNIKDEKEEVKQEEVQQERTQGVQQQFKVEIEKIIQQDLKEQVLPKQNKKQDVTVIQEIKQVQSNNTAVAEEQEKPQTHLTQEQPMQSSQIKIQENIPKTSDNNQHIKQSNQISDAIKEQLNTCQKQNEKPVQYKQVKGQVTQIKASQNINSSITAKTNSFSQTPKQEIKAAVVTPVAPTYTLKASLKSNNILGSSAWGIGLNASLKNSLANSKEEDTFKFDLDF